MIVTFLSDYGLRDEFVGVCHAVIARAAPAVDVIDLTHAIERHDVRRGALALRRALPYAPAGVHLAVVDPGVGTPRRAVALRTVDEGRLLVGPDNGLLWPAAQTFGGVREAVDIGSSRHRLAPVSATFHGRDVFAPVAAALAAGAPLREAGTALDVASLVALELPRATVAPGRIDAHALTIDGFGNVALDVEGPANLTMPVRVNGEPVALGATFADVPAGELVLYRDSVGALALAVNGGSAAQRLNLTLDADVVLEWR